MVRQSISKWEKGSSVPDSDMLIYLSEAFETPINILLGETIGEKKIDDLGSISEKLKIINVQLAQRKNLKRKMFHWFFISVCVFIIVLLPMLIILNSPYLT